MYLVNYNLSLEITRTSMKCLDSLAEVNPEDCGLDSQRTLLNILNKYGKDQEIYDTLGVELDDNEYGYLYAPSIFASELKTGENVVLQEYSYLCNRWVLKNDKNAVEECVKGAFELCRRDFIDDSKNQGEKRVFEHIKNADKMIDSYMKNAREGERSDAEIIATMAFSGNQSGLGCWRWQDAYKAMKTLRPDVIDWLAKYGFKTRKDFVDYENRYYK